MTPKRFLGIVFRLSMVAGIAVGFYDAANRYLSWNAERVDLIKSRIVMECAARLDDDWLAQHKNRYGNYDVATVCGPGSDGKTYAVSPAEIASTRQGEDIFAKYTLRQPYDVIETAIGAIVGFVAVNLLGLALVGVYLIGRWIAFGGRR